MCLFLDWSDCHWIAVSQAASKNKIGQTNSHFLAVYAVPNETCLASHFYELSVKHQVHNLFKRYFLCRTIFVITWAALHCFPNSICRNLSKNGAFSYVFISSSFGQSWLELEPSVTSVFVSWLYDFFMNYQQCICTDKHVYHCIQEIYSEYSTV